MQSIPAGLIILEPGQMMSQPQRTLISDSPTISRNVVLHCVGDWGQANWHKIMAWITQEFTERCGNRSRTCIWSVRGGGMDPMELVFNGDAQVAINTPVKLLKSALSGEGIFSGRSMENLRALATIPQNDRLMLGLAPSLGCKSFADLREKRPKLKIILGPDNGDSLIGYCAHRLLEAHGVSVETIKSWGGEILTADRPEECLLPAHDAANGITAVVQEAIMAPWWTELIDHKGWIPIPAERDALDQLYRTLPGLPGSSLPAGWWENLKEDIPALEFRDFLVFCRDDLPDDVAYLLTWIMVNTKHVLERQYYGFPPEKSPVGWPMDPKKMAVTTLPLHPGAERFYRENKFLE